MNFDQFNNEIYINLGVIAGLTFLAIIIARTIIFKALLSFASKSDTEHDDALIKTFKKPLTLIPLGIGLYALMQALPLTDNYNSYADLLIRSYFYLAIFWSIADTTDSLRDFVGEKYDFLSTTLRAWIFRTLKLVFYLLKSFERENSNKLLQAREIYNRTKGLQNISEHELKKFNGLMKYRI